MKNKKDINSKDVINFLKEEAYGLSYRQKVEYVMAEFDISFEDAEDFVWNYLNDFFQDYLNDFLQNYGA